MSSSIGLRFDCRDLYKVEFDTSGLTLGGYGVAAYFLFWSLIDPKALAGAVLSSGDVRTVPDTGDRFCIGVQHPDFEVVNRLRLVSQQWPPFTRAGLSFLDSSNLHRASLPDDAYIDEAGQVTASSPTRPIALHLAEGLWKARGINLREVKPQSIAVDTRKGPEKHMSWQFWRRAAKPAVPAPDKALADVLTYWTTVAGGVSLNAGKLYQCPPGTGESMEAEEHDQFQRLIAFGPSAIPHIELAALAAIRARASNPYGTDNASTLGYTQGGFLCLALGAVGTTAAYDALHRIWTYASNIDVSIHTWEHGYRQLMRRVYVSFELLAKNDARAKNMIQKLNERHALHLQRR